MLSQVLRSLQQGAPDQALSNYGDFYSELVAVGNVSWQDHLLDEVMPSLHRKAQQQMAAKHADCIRTLAHALQIMSGRNNALAKAAAQGKLAEESGPVHAAMAHDLDILQKLSIAESTLAGLQAVVMALLC